MPATPAWLASVEAVLNRGIDASSQAGALAQRLNGTSLRVEVEDWMTLRISVCAGRLAFTAVGEPDDGGADASLKGSPLAFLSLARGGGQHASARGLQVRGDAETANLYRQLLTLARPDVEEEVSRIVGDFPARRLALVARGGIAWAQRLTRTAGENVAEYLQEESRDLVNKVELAEFLQGVDALRETADRVEARLARLELRFKGSV